MNKSHSLTGETATDLPRYRELERLARHRAESTKLRPLRQSYLELARGWAELADRLATALRSGEKD